MSTPSFDAGARAYERFAGRWSRLYVPALIAAAGIRPGQRVLDDTQRGLKRPLDLRIDPVEVVVLRNADA